MDKEQIKIERSVEIKILSILKIKNADRTNDIIDNNLIKNTGSNENIEVMSVLINEKKTWLFGTG